MSESRPVNVRASRAVRRAVLSLVPGNQRARLRQWYQSASAPARRASASFAASNGAVAVCVDGGPDFLIPPHILAEIEVHFTNGEHAAEIAAFLRESVSPGTLFDVGANNGLFSLLFCRLHPINRSFGYEPSTIFAERAESVARLNRVESRMRMVRRAVSNSEDPRALLVDERSGRVQARQFAGTVQESWVSHSLPATTLDAECARVGVPSIVKIDVEGDELEVLQGAQRLLDHGRPVVMLELHLNFLEERGVPVSQIVDPLTRAGYALYDLAGHPLPQKRLARSWASVAHVVARPRG